MAEADVLDQMPPAGLPDETDEQRRQRLANPRLPLPDAMPPAMLGGATPQPAPPKPIMPPAAVAPAQPPANANAPQPAAPTMPPAMVQKPPAEPVRPELHGWKRALDVAGSLFPVGQAIEAGIPGTPQNFDVREAMKAARAEMGQKVRKGEVENETSEQNLEDARAKSQFNTPEKRQAYVQEHPDQFNDVSDFERNDFVLSGKFPQREPAPPKEDQKIDEGYNSQGQRVIQYQKPDGTVYNRVNPDILKAAPEDANKLAGEIEAQAGPKPTTPEYNGKTYPSVQAAQAAWGKEAERIKNEEAASAAGARGGAYGRNRPVQVVDTWNGNRPVTVSAADAEDNPERYLTAGGAEKALPREALINDIRVSAETVGKNLDVLNAKGVDRATLAAALADPNSTAQAYMQGLPRGALDDKAQTFVSDLFNLREQAMALRQVLGAGAGSEDMRHAILATLPSIASPNAKFAQHQIDNLISVLNRVERGIPKVPLNPERAAPGGATGGFANWDAAHPVK
jgi:hypothetical protein